MRVGTSVVVGALAACHGGSAVSPDAQASSDGSVVVVPDAGPPPTEVPRTMETIKIDGDWDETDWNQRALQLVFADDTGMQARPYSEVRFLYDNTNLYIGAYAADNDIETSDFFQFTLGLLDVRINPYGDVEASAPGVVAAAEYDGTIGDPNDYDEEWLLEARSRSRSPAWIWATPRRCAPRAATSRRAGSCTAAPRPPRSSRPARCRVSWNRSWCWRRAGTDRTHRRRHLDRHRPARRCRPGGSR